MEQQMQMVMDLLRMFLRRWLIIAAVIGCGVAASAFFAYILPPIYQSEAKILVESQQIPDDLARSTVTASASERLQLIQQRLMTRDNLIRVIDEMRLFADRPDLRVTEKVAQLREATVIRPIALTGRRSFRGEAQLSAFTIRVTYNSPNKAAQVANAFVTTVLDQNIRARSERASETLSFFSNEEARLADALRAMERDIAEYKDANKDALPDSLEFRRAEISRLTDADFEIDRSILELEERRAALVTARDQAEAAAERAKAAAAAGTVGLSPEELELRALETELAEKRAVFAEGHRVIRALNARIDALEATRPKPVAAASPAEDEDQGEAALKIQSQATAFTQQIVQVDNQIELLRDQKRNIEAKGDAIRETVQRTPNIEIQLNALFRRHQELQDQYSVIVRKRTEAETGEKLEVNQQAERFEVIENAIAPDRPVSPNRKKIVIMGSAASIALALGLVFAIELLRPAIRTASQMQRQLDLRPVVTIPYIRTRSERRWRIFSYVFGALAICVGLPALLYGIDQHFMPLALIGEKIIDRTGVDEFIRMVEARF